MKLTNKLGLPSSIVQAVQNNSYDPGHGDFSVTALLDPPQKRYLMQKHSQDLVEDASDMIWSLMGQLMHNLLERADKEESIKEHRFYKKIGDHTISGQIDRYVDGTLQDYKFITAWKVKDGVPIEYEQQLNLYAHLLRCNNVHVERLELICILRDWSKLEAKRSPDYPQNQVMVLPVRVWSDDAARVFMEKRLELHLSTPSPECSASDMWTKPTVWALMKPGKERAEKLYYAEEEVNNRLELEKQNGSKIDWQVVVRPGERVRCENYCSVSKFCNQYQQYKEKQNVS